MVPREPGDNSEDEAISGSDSEGGSEHNLNGQPHESDHEAEIEDEEEEYHTERSDEEVLEEEDEENDSGSEVPVLGAPLLPKELLKPLPSPAYSSQYAATIPWEQMTRPQKRAKRNRSRQAKKKVWDRLKKDTQGTGVIEAGQAAQIKRGLVLSSNRVKTGRVSKKTKIQLSGRQQLLEQRKRLVGEHASELMRPSKKSKTKS